MTPAARARARALLEELRTLLDTEEVSHREITPAKKPRPRVTDLDQARADRDLRRMGIR